MDEKSTEEKITVNEQNSSWTTLRRLFKMVKPVCRTMIKCIIYGILGNLSGIFILTFGSMLIASIIGYEPIPFSLLCIITIIVGLTRGILRYWEQLHGHDVAFRLLALIRTQIFEKFRILSPAKLMSKRSGDSLQMIQADVESIETFFAHTIAPVIIALIVPSIVLIFIGVYGILYALILLLAYLLLGLGLPILQRKNAKNIGQDYRKTLSKINTQSLDTLQGLKDIILFNQHEKIIAQTKQQSSDLMEKMGIIRKKSSENTAIAELIIFLSTIFIFITGILQLANNSGLSQNIKVAQLIIVVITSYSSFGPILAMVPLHGHLKSAIAAADRIFALMDENPLVSDELDAYEIKDLFKEDLNLDFNQISFKYPNTTTQILKELSFKITKGQNVAIIGESGIGKSTLLYLFLRYWDVDEGYISFNNIRNKSLSLNTIRSQIAIFSQTTYLFNSSIKDNILIGNLNATMEEVISVAKMVNIHDFIMTLPKGYETNVGELGGKVSSGERQRIGLARTLLKNSEIILLDEPTSNLDFLNEKSLLKSINSLLFNKTILMISHRPSTIKQANIVWELKNLKLARKK